VKRATLGPADVLVVGIALDSYRGDEALLSGAEGARFRRMRSTAKRREFLVGRSAMRRVLGRLMRTEPQDVRFELGAHGKPGVAGEHRLYFNLSHSSERAVLAVTRGGPVGVDIEAARPGRPFHRLAKRFFAAPEYESLQGLSATEFADGFYRLWTLKEAYLKAIGTGLTLSSRAFEIDAGDPPRLVKTAEGHLGADHWGLQVLPAEAGYHVALCTPAGVSDVRPVALADC